MPPIVRIADPRGSTPTPLSLLGVALSCTAVGLVLVKLSLAAPTPEASSLPPTASAGSLRTTGDGPAPTPTEQHAEPDPEPTTTAVPDVSGAAAPLAAVADSPSGPADVDARPSEATGALDPAPNQAGTARAIEPGRVAYFRCPNDSCPRDHGLERSVWRSLDRLGSCLGSPGEADVRVSVLGGAVTDVLFRERGPAGIDLGVLERCVSPPLMRLSGSNLPDGAVVSFRFQVR